MEFGKENFISLHNKWKKEINSDSRTSHPKTRDKNGTIGTVRLQHGKAWFYFDKLK